MRILWNLVPCSVEQSQSAHSLTRSKEKNFGNNSRQESSPDFGAESASFSLRISWYVESERSALTDVGRAYLYFGMFTAPDTLESFKIHPKTETSFSTNSTVSVQGGMKFQTNFSGSFLVPPLFPWWHTCMVTPLYSWVHGC